MERTKRTWTGPPHAFAMPPNWRDHPKINEWQSAIDKHNAIIMRDGDIPGDYPENAIAFWTEKFAWISSKETRKGFRNILYRLEHSMIPKTGTNQHEFTNPRVIH